MDQQAVERAALLRFAEEVEAEANLVPLGEAFHGGGLDDAPKYDVMVWAARRARADADAVCALASVQVPADEAQLRDLAVFALDRAELPEHARAIAERRGSAADVALLILRNSQATLETVTALRRLDGLAAAEATIGLAGMGLGAGI